MTNNNKQVTKTKTGETLLRKTGELQLRKTGENKFAIYTYLADSFFVLILASALIKEPLTIIRESVIELAGGTLQDKVKREEFEAVINFNMPEILKVEGIFISKNGSQYIVRIYISTNEDFYSRKDIFETKAKIIDILSKDHPHLSLDIIPEGKPILTNIK